jgi:hypothetical protein
VNLFVKISFSFERQSAEKPGLQSSWRGQAKQPNLEGSEAAMKLRTWTESAKASRGRVAIILLMACLLLWLWPIGVGGKMPVGGDVTQFFLGLMGVLGTALRDGRLPIWNDLWGYGFPGIGESQMGVYYPPHLVLYGLLPTEWAYVHSLLLHTLWGALGAWWAARQFGVTPMGSSLAAFAFSASGFFVIHMPHPWGYTTGSWMPWAWGLTWSFLTSPRPNVPVKLFLLSLVLVLQMLPGHFQIAFLTQVGIILMVVWYVLEPWICGERVEDSATGIDLARRTGQALAIGGCLIAVFPLSAVQLWPTARLARLAAAQRDFEYLSGFAATPWHLVNYIAPALFHRSPLWRPLVWNPFHTTPEEQLGYVGLVPLFLAILVILHEFRRDRSIRILAILVGVTLFLSLGPYFPGFRLLINLPGFSFFRAPARWSLATVLALSILAGKGLDRCLAWPRPGRSLAWLAGLSAAWILVVLGLIELALGSGLSAGRPWLAGLFQRAFQSRPWTGDFNFRAVLAEARRPASDPRIPAELVKSGLVSPPVDPRSFVESRAEIYARELASTTGLLVGILAVACLTSPRSRRRHFPACLILLTFLDLMILSRHRLVAVGPMRRLVNQSPVLAQLAREPRGTRIIDGLRNLPMLVGMEPVVAYRTLDLPVLEPLTNLARGPLGDDRFRAGVRKAMRAAGVGVRVLDPVETTIERWRARSKVSKNEPETVDDPVLAGWIFGPDWGSEQGAWSSRFRILHPEPDPHRAWLLPLTAVSLPAMLEIWEGDIEPLLKLLDQASPLREESRGNQLMDVSVDADAPGWVIITQLADPQWRARWLNRDGQGEIPAEILPAFRRNGSEGGWQRIRVPGPGRWTLHLEYVATDVSQGLAISSVSWLIWCLIIAAAALRARGKEMA